MNAALLEKENMPAEDGVSTYLQEIRQYPRLTPEQERGLAVACARGDADAIRTMVNSNLRLVASIAREYAGRGVPLLDLIQEGSIGLITAAKKFDYTLELRFSTYATKWIRQGISRYIMDHAELIRVPEYTLERMRKIRQTRDTLYQQTGVMPTEEQLADACGFPADKVRELMRLFPEVCSLDVPLQSEDEGTLGMLLENTNTPCPEEALVRRELKDLLDKLLERLTTRQQQVIRLYCGLEDDTCYSLDQIGQKLGISKERARQIKHDAVEKLQKLGAGLGLEDFLV